MTEKADETQEPNRANDAAQSPFLNPESVPVAPQDGPPPRDEKRDGKSNKDSASLVARELHWLEKLNICGQIALVIVGITAASIYGCQLHVMQGQLSQMVQSGQQTDNLLCLYRQQLAEIQRQSFTSQRSALASTEQAIAITQSESAHVGLFGLQPILQLSEKLLIPYQLKNTGKTRATDLAGALTAVFISRDKDPNFSYPTNSFRTKNGFIEGGDAIPSGLTPQPRAIAVLDAQGQPITTDAQVIDDYNGGRKDIIEYGKFSYQDVFGVKHWFRLCQVFANVQTGISIRASHLACAKYTQADTNQILPANGPSPTPSMPIEETPCPLPEKGQHRK